MTVLATLMEHIERLVHPEVRVSEQAYLQHRVFVITKLALSFLTLLTVLAGFAVGHVPAAWEALALAWLTLPFAAVALVSKTKRIAAAQALCIVAWLGFGIAAAAHGGLGPAGWIALLLVVLIEASASGTLRMLRFGVEAVLLGVAGLAVVIVGFGARGPSVAEAWILMPMLLYAVTLASVARRGQIDQMSHLVRELRGQRTLAEAVGDLVLRCDRTGLVAFANAAAEKEFSIPPRDLLGRGLFERVHVADRPALLKTFGDVAAGGRTLNATVRLRTGGDPQEPGLRQAPVFAWAELKASPAPDEVGALVVVVRDVSAQVEHEAAVRAARDEAERANAWKDAFIANVSHELRTPLNAIIGFSEILASPGLNPQDPAKRHEYAAIIKGSGEHLLSVVNSLLDISKIEAGRFDLEPESFDMAAVIQGCCDMIGLKAEQAGVAIVHEAAAWLPALTGDKRACRQIIINLLSNALKFTARGGRVTIAARAQGHSLMVTVADTGVGIAPADLARVGDPFFQGRSGYDRPFEGTGLGLSVVRGLVGLHGGGITLDSALGEGTRVTVRLPLDCRTAATVPSAAIEIRPRMRTVVLSDQADLPRIQKRA